MVICFVTVVIYSSVIYIGVNLVAILNWNMKDAIVVVMSCISGMVFLACRII